MDDIKESAEKPVRLPDGTSMSAAWRRPGMKGLRFPGKGPEL